MGSDGCPMRVAKWILAGVGFLAICVAALMSIEDFRERVKTFLGASPLRFESEAMDTLSLIAQAERDYRSTKGTYATRDQLMRCNSALSLRLTPDVYHRYSFEIAACTSA